MQHSSFPILATSMQLVCTTPYTMTMLRILSLMKKHNLVRFLLLRKMVRLASQLKEQTKLLSVFVLTNSPSFLREKLEGGVAIGLAGSLEVEMTGPVEAGDLLVSAKDGKACKANVIDRLFKSGAILGKVIFIQQRYKESILCD
jgi:hypothetical protein